jgi:hypothetical protein
LTVNGGVGVNSLIAEDSSDATTDIMTVTGALADGTVGATAGDGFFGNSGALYYSGLASMTINMGTGGDNVWVRSTAAFINTTTINTGGGGDNIKVDSNGPAALGNVNGIKSMLVIDGGPGPNFAVLEDTNDANANAVTLTSSQVGAASSDNFFGSGGKLNYASLTSLTLNMGDGGNDINVQGTGCGTSIYTGGGNDSVVIDSNGIGAGGTVDLVQHTLFVNGQVGTDGLSMNDLSDLTGDTFNITNAQIGAMAGNNFFGVGGSIGYLDMSLITVGATSGPDGIIVNATAAGTPLLIRGNDGGDVLHVFAPIASSITFQAGNPTVPLGDSLEIVGNGATQGSYTPSATTPGSGTILLDGQTVSFSGLEPVTVSKMLDFQVVTPSSHDVITIDRPVPGRNRVTGSSDGVAFESLTFFDVQRFTLNTGLADGTTAQSSDDTITIASPGLDASGLVNFKLIGGVGFDRLNVNGGTLTFDTDAFPDTQSLDVNVNNASVIFKATEHLNALNLLTQGHAQMTAGGGRVLVVKSLFVDTANKALLDLTDQDMIINYTGGSPIGSWNGSAYTGITGLLQSAYNFGAWDGSTGIRTSMPDAANGLTTLAIGEASDALFISGTETALWNGQTVDATSVLVKYTYAGDLTFDGVVDAADYGSDRQLLPVPRHQRIRQRRFHVRRHHRRRGLRFN